MKTTLIDYLLNEATKGEVKITYCGQTASGEDLWQITRYSPDLKKDIYIALQGTKDQVINSLKMEVKYGN